MPRKKATPKPRKKKVVKPTVLPPSLPNPSEIVIREDRIPFFWELSHEFLRLRGTQKAFLVAYAYTGNITKSAEIAGVIRESHYDWLRSSSSTSEEYTIAFKKAQEESVEREEYEAWRRAVIGTREYKFHQGVPILHPVTGEPYYEHRYSDNLLMFRLRANKPEKYRDIHEHELKGQINHAHVHGMLTMEQLRELPLDVRKTLLEKLRESESLPVLENTTEETTTEQSQCPDQ